MTYSKKNPSRPSIFWVGFLLVCLLACFTVAISWLKPYFDALRMLGEINAGVNKQPPASFEVTYSLLVPMLFIPIIFLGLCVVPRFNRWFLARWGMGAMNLIFFGLVACAIIGGILSTKTLLAKATAAGYTQCQKLGDRRGTPALFYLDPCDCDTGLANRFKPSWELVCQSKIDPRPHPTPDNPLATSQP